MKIQVVSDLHKEFGQIDDNYNKMVETEADVLVLAGDITSSDTVVEDLNRMQVDADKDLIFVPGNHEYYGSSRKTLDKEMMMIGDINPKVHVLLERDVCIGGVCFLGTTGWWDGSGGSIGLTVKNGLSDFRMVYDLMDEGNLDGVKWGRLAKTYLSSRMHWLRHNLPDMKLCVITHHFPHRRSIHPHFAGSPLNSCFYNSWEDLILQYRPEVWIHGHTHCPFDYVVKENDGHPHIPIVDERTTRIVCNPQGYPMEYAMPVGKIEDYYTDFGLSLDEGSMKIYTKTENEVFDPCKIIEL